MNGILKQIFLAVVALIISAPATLAQTNAAWPMTPGETLNYEVKLDKVLPGWSIADLAFTFDKASDSDNFVIKTEAESKGTLLKLFRFSFLQRYDSLLENGTFRVLRTTKFDEQKERVRNSDAIFDYVDHRVTYIETDPKDPNRPPRRIASTITSPMHDIVTGIYALRALPLAVGKRFTLEISDSGLVYQVPVSVTAREQQKSALGKVWCYRIEPAIFGKGRLVEQKGSMIIWITEDARRLPVRARIKTEFGKIEIKLRSVANSREANNVGQS